MNERPYITCRELIGFLDDYVAGALATDTLAEFDRHLAVCPSCRAYLASYETTVALARNVIGDEPAPDDVPDDLLQAIMESRAK